MIKKDTKNGLLIDFEIKKIALNLRVEQLRIGDNKKFYEVALAALFISIASLILTASSVVQNQNDPLLKALISGLMGSVVVYILLTILTIRWIDKKTSKILDDMIEQSRDIDEIVQKIKTD